MTIDSSGSGLMRLAMPAQPKATKRSLHMPRAACVAGGFKRREVADVAVAHAVLRRDSESPRQTAAHGVHKTTK